MAPGRLSVVYDTGALIAAERGLPRMIALHSRFVQRLSRPVVPSVVLAQAWRGGPQPRLSRLLLGCAIAADEEPLARAAGVLCAGSGTSDVVDALVVVTARILDAAIVTSDPGDLGVLCEVARWRPMVFTV